MNTIKRRKSKDFDQGFHEVQTKKVQMIRRLISLVLIIYTFITFFVIAVTILDSLKTKEDLVTNFIGLPQFVSLDNFTAVFKKGKILRNFINSVLVTGFGTAGCLLLSSMAAYGLARYEFKGRELLKSYFLIGVMVPVQVTVLPLFIILRTIGLLNHLPGMILVYASGISLNCMIFQKFFATIPKSLEEAARLDGCSDVGVFFRIILPITKPILFTMALITAIAQWNDFYMPMVLLGGKDTSTLTLAIYRYIGQFTRYMGESMAAVILTLIPVITIYFAFSSRIMEGATGGAVKG